MQYVLLKKHNKTRAKMPSLYIIVYKVQQITFSVHIYNSKLLQKRIAEEYNVSNLRYLAQKYDYSL